MGIRPQIIERVKAVATEFDLVSVDFLDKNGNYCSKDYRRCRRVRLGFKSGEEIVITKQEFESLADFEFKVGTQPFH